MQSSPPFISSDQCYIIGSGYIAGVLRDGFLDYGIQPTIVTSQVNPAISQDQKVISADDLVNLLKRSRFNPETKLIINSTGPGHAAITQQEADEWLQRQLIITTSIASHGDNSRIILISSGGTVYGDHGNRPLDEGAELRGVTPYARYQILVESMYRRFFTSNLTILRVANPYGYRQFKKAGQGFVSTAIRNLFEDNPTIIYGDGNLVRDYLYEEDLFDLLPSLCSQKVSGVFNIGSGAGYSQLEILDTVEKILGKRSRVIFKPGRQGDIVFSRLEVEAAKNALGWKAASNISEGIQKTLTEYLRANK